MLEQWLSAIPPHKALYVIRWGSNACISRNKWEKEIEGLASAVTDRIKKAEDETLGKEAAFYTKLENLRLKRLRQQGRIK
jgi:hypothetical protein